MTRDIIDLGGTDWRFGCVPLKPIDAQPDDRAEVGEWLPATVPGNVRTDLLALGRIEDPFYHTNSEASRWVDGFNWWYARPLELDLDQGQRAFLCFEGIDYISAAYFDEAELGCHEGMFSRQVYEISGLNKPGTSTLAVRIQGSDLLPRRQLSWWEKIWSPMATALQGGREAFPHRSATLKCQMSFGWDFAPRIRTMGLWDDATLVVTRSVFVSDVFIQTDPEGAQASVTLRATIDSDRAQNIAAIVTVRTRGSDQTETWRWDFDLSLKARLQTVEMGFTIPRPRLWHPWDRGEPHQYELELRIVRDDQVLDSMTEVFGVRRVEMAPNPASPRGSENWTMVINGSRVYVRGANWVPPDALPGRLRRGDYETAIGMAREAGINLLRVWGGGLREKRAFYDLCDEQGIMVWQEFPLACLLLGHFPRSTRFRHLLRQEGRSIVRQLRNHPSLVLWCGGNEFSYRRNRRLIDSLHEVVSAEDGTRPFRKASPGRSDTHNWLVWHGKAPIRDYRNDHSRFSSEFGLQSVPHASSLSRFLTTEDLFPPNDVWCHHCAQLEKLERYAGPVSSTVLEEWVEATQRGQANGLQVAIEHFRRRKYRTSGTAIWQFNEPWPAISWSLIDYYGQPKLAYERLKSLYNPVLVSLEFPLREYQKGYPFCADVWCVNDLLTPFAECSVKVQLDGEEVFSRMVSLPPDSCQRVGSMEVILDKDPVELAVRLLQGERVISANTYDLTYYDPANATLLDVLSHRVVQWLRE